VLKKILCIINRTSEHTDNSRSYVAGGRDLHR